MTFTNEDFILAAHVRELAIKFRHNEAEKELPKLRKQAYDPEPSKDADGEVWTAWREKCKAQNDEVDEAWYKQHPITDYVRRAMAELGKVCEVMNQRPA